MSDDRERIDLLREDLDLESQRYEYAETLLAPTQGADDRQVVEVRLDRDGVLEVVTVTHEWRRFYAGGEVAAAIMQAYGVAAGERTAAWGAAGVDDQRPHTSARPAARTSAMTDEVTEALRARADSIDPSVLDALGAFLDDLDRGFDQAMADVEAMAVNPIRGRSSSGHVTADVVGSGQLVDLTIDERWVETAHSFNIGREATEAFHDALRRLAERTAASMRDSGMTRLQALAADPAEMIRYLGLS